MSDENFLSEMEQFTNSFKFSHVTSPSRTKTQLELLATLSPSHFASPNFGNDYESLTRTNLNSTTILNEVYDHSFTASFSPRKRSQTLTKPPRATSNLNNVYNDIDVDVDEFERDMDSSMADFEIAHAADNMLQTRSPQKSYSIIPPPPLEASFNGKIEHYTEYLYHKRPEVVIAAIDTLEELLTESTPVDVIRALLLLIQDDEFEEAVVLRVLAFYKERIECLQYNETVEVVKALLGSTDSITENAFSLLLMGGLDSIKYVLDIASQLDPSKEVQVLKVLTQNSHLIHALTGPSFVRALRSNDISTRMLGLTGLGLLGSAAHESRHIVYHAALTGSIPSGMACRVLHRIGAGKELCTLAVDSSDAEMRVGALKQISLKESNTCLLELSMDSTVKRGMRNVPFVFIEDVPELIDCNAIFEEKISVSFDLRVLLTNLVANPEPTTKTVRKIAINWLDQVLKNTLSDEDPRVVVESIRLIRSLQLKKYVPRLVAIIDTYEESTNLTVIEESVITLGVFQEHIGVITKLLDHSFVKPRKAVVVGLCMSRNPIYFDLVQNAFIKGSLPRHFIAEQLLLFPNGAEYLLDVAEDSAAQARLRQASIRGLARFKDGEDHRTVARIVQLMYDMASSPVYSLRTTAIQTLLYLSKHLVSNCSLLQERSVEQYVYGLMRENSDIAKYAAKQLSKLGIHGEMLLLTALLKERNLTIRMNALDALEINENTIRSLMMLLTDEEYEVSLGSIDKLVANQETVLRVVRRMDGIKRRSLLRTTKHVTIRKNQSSLAIRSLLRNINNLE
ncbi:hypothetical protein PCE1_003668 [Barthelona sp. PCE]